MLVLFIYLSHSWICDVYCASIVVDRIIGANVFVPYHGFIMDEMYFLVLWLWTWPCDLVWPMINGQMWQCASFEPRHKKPHIILFALLSLWIPLSWEELPFVFCSLARTTHKTLQSTQVTHRSVSKMKAYFFIPLILLSLLYNLVMAVIHWYSVSQWSKHIFIRALIEIFAA